MIDEKLQAELRAKYNPDGSTLRKAQLRMLEILKCVDGICRKHNIQYWLSSGTLLGAVRHGGFIPWDDDLDIEMLREDYLKLIPILRKELPKNFVLQDMDSDIKHPHLFAKVRDRNSQIDEGSKLNSKYNGIFIDIFALEKTPYCLFKIASILYNNLCYKCYNKGVLFRFNRLLLLKLIFPILRIISKLSSSKSNTLRHLLGMSFYSERNILEIFPLCERYFEGFSFYVPNDCEKYLKRTFGDYMKLPDGITQHGIIKGL